MSSFKVLGVELTDLYELIRFNLNTKQDRVGLFTYRASDNIFHLGFYYPSFLKRVALAFIYISLTSPPEKIYSYSNDLNGREVILYEPSDSPSFINIPVAYLRDIPHGFISLDEIEDSWKFIEVEDLRSLVTLGSTAYFETSDIPYIWYDVNRETYLLNIYSSGDGIDMNLYFYWVGEYMGPYIYVSRDFNEVGASDNIRDVSKNYFLIVRSKELPYLGLGYL